MGALVVGVLGIIASFSLLILGSWKKVSTFLISVVCAGIVGLTNGIGFFGAISGPYMNGFIDFVESWIIIIALGALLGGFYSNSGAAWRIADTLIKKTGNDIAIIIYVLVGALLVYGGIFVPVVVFILLPFAKVIFPRTGIPWTLFPGVTGLSVATFAMYCPGSLQLVNLIPQEALGTTPTAAPFEGIIASIFLLVVGIMYLKHEIKKSQKDLSWDVPESYKITRGESISDEEMNEKAPSFIVSLTPIIVTLILVNFLSVNMMAGFIAGCILSAVMFRKNINDMSDCISQGFNDGIMPCILISAVVGIGSVIAETPVFAIIRDNVINLPINGLTKIALVTTIVSGVCASATGGLKITMDLFGKQFLATGFPPEIVHRVAAIASGGLDSLPWCGTIVTLFTLSGVGYNKGYKAVAVETVILPIVASLLAVLVYTVRISIMG